MRIKNDMRRSPFPEHKLEFRTYVRGQAGGILLAKMEKHSGRSREDLMALLSTVRPLEFYMPVATQRESWRGEGSLIVASVFSDTSQIVAFNTSGEPISLELDEVPELPTFVLNPVETDFTRPLDLTQVKNVRDQGGETIGTFAIRPPDECVDCGGGGPTYYPPGIYFTEMVIYDKHEPILRGEPELEIHIFGQKRGVVREYPWGQAVGLQSPYYWSNPYGSNTVVVYRPNEAQTIAFDCAGEEATPLIRNFNFNGEGGARYYSNTLFAEQSRFVVSELLEIGGTLLDRRNVPLEPPFRIQILERDDGRQCPVAPRKVQFNIQVSVNLAPGSWTDLVSVKNLAWEDVSYLLGGSNDLVSEWYVPTYAALEQMNGTWLLGSNAFRGRDADVKLVNRGFNHSSLPPFEEFRWP